LDSGYWFVEDMQSRNGTKVSGTRITHKKRLDPGVALSVAKHQYRIHYSPMDLGAVGPPPPDEESDQEGIFGKSLLERAGIARRKLPERTGRYDVTNDEAGQIKDPNRPLQ
jgi:adenylate cyclase